jgi:DNA-binding transcriptional LysR family regulator
VTLAYFVALDAFVAEPSACDDGVARLVLDLQAELRVVLCDREGRPTPAAQRLAAEGRLALAAVDAFYAVAEDLSHDAGGAVVLSLSLAPASGGTPR